MENNNTSGRQRLRPQVYVHFEFGMSLGPNRTPHHHEMTYRSRGLRERSPNFPRAVPAPSTNFLTPSAQHTQHTPNQTRAPQSYYYYGGPPNPARQPEPIYYYGGPTRQPEHAQNERPRRTSRDERPREGSHERGSSAPPPFGDNPWDVNVLQAGDATFSPSPLTGTLRSPQPVDAWKALPEIPSRFRLGEDDMPWDAWSIPVGYDPDTHPQDEEAGPSSSTNDNCEPLSSGAALATTPTDVSTFSIDPIGPPYQPDDPGRIKELAGLSSAMMTVDNGFEHQWWYQGGRESVVTGEAAGVVPQPRFSRNSLGWAIASTPDLRQAERHNSVVASIASPSTNYSGAFTRPETPDSFPQPLTRSLSTRSDELFFDRGDRNDRAKGTQEAQPA
jgi:hypothetical protein